MIEVIVNPRVASMRARLDDQLNELPGGPYRITIEAVGEVASAAQHRRYRFMLTQFCEATGMAYNDAHNHVKDVCLPHRNDVSLADLTKREFTDLMERFEAYAAAEAGVQVI